MEAGHSARRGTVVATQWITIVGFIAVISLPGLGLLQGEGEHDDLSEKRRLAAWPELGWQQRSIQSFPSRFDAYFQDHFGLRRSLIRWNNLVGVHWLGLTPASLAVPSHSKLASTGPEVLRGKQGWLFFTGGRAIDDYRCVSPFTRGQLDEWVETLAARRQWLAAQSIEYLLVIPPNKHSIYSEYLPRSINRLRKRSRLDQLLARLAELPDFPVLDLRAPLLEAKSVERCYHQTDSHWNDFGAWVGYTAIMHYLERDRATFRPWPCERFCLKKFDRAGGDLAMMLGLEDVLREEWYDLVPPVGDRQSSIVEQRRSTYQITVSEHPDATLPRAVVFRDSFFNALQPFFSEHFSRVTYAWTYDFDIDLIVRERPQVVVQEVIERSFMGIDPQNPPQLTRALAQLADRDAASANPSPTSPTRSIQRK